VKTANKSRHTGSSVNVHPREKLNPLSMKYNTGAFWIVASLFVTEILNETT